MAGQWSDVMHETATAGGFKRLLKIDSGKPTETS